MYWIAFGDIHESTGVLSSIPGLARADGVIISGDLTNRGSRVAGEHVLDAVAAVNPHILAQPGNMDTYAVQEVLCERGMNFHRMVRELAPGVGLMGVGLSTPTPFNTPGEVSEETLSGWLDETHAGTGHFDKLVVVIHEPPANTAVDRLGDGRHVGSLSVRRFIERVQPDIFISGHIHESRGVDRIGKTPVFNPGMLAGGGFVRIDYDNGELSAELMSV